MVASLPNNLYSEVAARLEPGKPTGQQREQGRAHSTARALLLQTHRRLQGAHKASCPPPRGFSPLGRDDLAPAPLKYEGT